MKKSNECVRNNEISLDHYTKSSNFLKESLCYYDKESQEELELSELVEAFIFAAFDFEKGRSNIDYLISDLKEPIQTKSNFNFMNI